MVSHDMAFKFPLLSSDLCIADTTSFLPVLAAALHISAWSSLCLCFYVTEPCHQRNWLAHVTKSHAKSASLPHGELKTRQTSYSFTLTISMYSGLTSICQVIICLYILFFLKHCFADGNMDIEEKYKGERQTKVE